MCYKEKRENYIITELDKKGDFVGCRRTYFID